MRVITGKYQYMNILNYSDNQIRPTMDRAKEGIFNVINYNITEKTFLDLYSGTGNIGIEALSRGASFVTFVDNNRDAIKLINNNTSKLSEQNFQIIQSDALKFAVNNEKKFDYIFLDPPYNIELEEFSKVVEAMKKSLENEGYLIIELNYEYQNAVEGLVKQKTRKYGKTYFTVFQKECDE